MNGTDQGLFPLKGNEPWSGNKPTYLSFYLLYLADLSKKKRNDEEELRRKFKQTNDEDKKKQKIKVQIQAAEIGRQ